MRKGVAATAWLVLAAAMLAFAKFHVFSCCDEERQVNVLLTLVCPLPIAIGVTYLVIGSALKRGRPWAHVLAVLCSLILTPVVIVFSFFLSDAFLMVDGDSFAVGVKTVLLRYVVVVLGLVGFLIQPSMVRALWSGAE